MTTQRRFFFFFLCGGLLALIDQTLKYLARTNDDFTWYILNPYLGWEYFENTGIAFSLPVPQSVIITISAGVIAILSYTLVRTVLLGRMRVFCATVLIMFGAISNFLDRILFGFTIDYLRVYTGVFNIADVLIVVGAVLFLYESSDRKSDI